MKKAIVIGSGIAGISAAIRLKHKGYQVDVYESNSYPGGKLSAFQIGKYRFDAGPSLFTMPHFVDELFQLFGENPRDFFSYKRKEIACEYFWIDGMRITAHADKKKFLQEIEKKLNVPAEQLDNYLNKAKKKYDLTVSLFLEKSLHRVATFLQKDTLKAIANLSLFELNKSLDDVNKQQLKNPYLIQLYNRYATYNGSSPFQTPGIMTLVQHLESFYGTFVPEGGMEQISQSLYRLAKRQGVQFYFNTKVDEILVENKKATHVRIGKDHLPADIIVSNMDIFPTYKKLLPKQQFPKKTLHQERSSSAVIFYWGIKKSFPQLNLHNIIFSADYRKEFEAIFKSRGLYEDPTVYINITSKDVPGDAPTGCENWFVMINTAADYGQDWDQFVTQLRKVVIAKIENVLSESFEDLIEVEEILTPPLIQAKTESHLGALYGSSSNNRMAAFWRHPNFSRKIKNLYFCGGSVHPGGGIPLCLLSAKIVSEQVP